MIRKNPLEKELEKAEIKHYNYNLLIYSISFIFIAVFIINPIMFLIGVIFFSREKKSMGIYGSIIIMVFSILISFITSIFLNIPFNEQITRFFMNFYELFTGKSVFLFFRDYILNPYSVFFLGLSLLLGIIAYFVFSTLSKEQFTFWESLKRFRNGKQVSFVENVSIKDFKKQVLNVEDLNHKDIGGTVLGKTGLHEVIATDEEMAGHALVVGTTGAGKTTTLLKFVESCVERCIPLFYVDGKGDEGLAPKIKKLCDKYNIKFYHFDIRGKQSKLCYNPLKLGNVDNTKEKLIDTTDWSEPHYKSAAERVLLLIANVVNQVRKETIDMDLKDLQKYFKLKEGEPVPKIVKDIVCLQNMLTPSVLEKIIRSIKDNELKNKWTGIYNKLNPDWYMGLEQRLALLAESTVGDLIKESQTGLKLTKVMDEKAVILFSLNSLENRNITEMMGRLIVKDINTAISSVDNKTKAYAIFDEHGAYISEDIESQLGMARSFQLRVITSTQNVSDYEKSKLGDILMRKVAGNTNLKIIMRQIEVKNAEYLSQLIGTKETLDKTTSTDYEGRFKGQGIKMVDEFVVNPNEIKDLKTGEAIVIKKLPKSEIIKDVKIAYIDIVHFDNYC